MTAFDASYYDGIHADERAMDAAADAGEASVRESFRPAAVEQAKDELTAQCHETGTVARTEWLQYKAEHGAITARGFVLANERVGGELVSDRVEAIIDGFVEGMADQ